MQVKYVLAVVFLLSIFALGQNSGSSSAIHGASTDISGQPQPPSVGLPAPHYQADFTQVIANGHHGVSWDKGHLVSFGLGEMKEPVTVYDKTGKWLFENPLTFENAIRTYAQDAAATSAGTAVVAASSVNGDGASADLIVEVDREGIHRVIRTSPFYPLKVCATDEGTVWVYGKELSEDRSFEPRAHYPMLREYSFDKGELRSALDRATVHPPKGVPLDGVKGSFQMRCTSGKVFLVSGPTNELMEYDLSASKLTRWPITPLAEGFYINGAAVTDSGEIYVSVLRPGQNARTGMLHLHLNSSGTVDWTPLTIVPPNNGDFFLLLGSDGESLVYSRGRAAPTLFWSRAQETGVTK
jgi:hypothetical protein